LSIPTLISATLKQIAFWESRIFLLTSNLVEELLRFYIHIKDGADLIRDEEGVDLPTAADARDQALHAARELVADAVISGRDLSADAFLIADQDEKQLAYLRTSEALPERLRY
jgi:hypothetical protein